MIKKIIYIILMLIVGFILIISLLTTIIISPLVIIFTLIKLVLKEIPKNTMIFLDKVFNSIDNLIKYLDNKFKV